MPLIPEQTINHSQQPSMSVEYIVKGLTESIKAIDFVEDNKIALGEINSLLGSLIILYVL